MKEYLIYDWFPINEVSVESIRERVPGIPYPPLNRLHVWFARRPLVSSRAAIVTSLLKEENRDQILRLLGIPPDKDLVAAQNMVTVSKATGNKIKNPFTWEQAYKNKISLDDLEWFHHNLKEHWNGNLPIILDPMAGGGSIPYEAVRLGLPVIAGDLNPVAYILLKATVEYPEKYREKLIPLVEEFCNNVHVKAKTELIKFYPKENDEKIFAYLWSRVVTCSNCNLQIPMSPNWWIVNKGDEKDMAVKIILPKSKDEVLCTFDIVTDPRSQTYNPNEGTDIGKEASCPRCHATMSGDKIKELAQAGKMDHQLYIVCSKRRVSAKRWKWHFRKPNTDDLDSIKRVEEEIDKRTKKWESNNLIPNTTIPNGLKTRELLNFGINKWSKLFNPRQLLAHIVYLEKIMEEKNKWLKNGEIEKELAVAASLYASIVFDSCVDYNCLLSLWDSTRVKISHMMSLQAFPFKTTYAEFDHSEMLWPWAQQKTIECLKELVDLLPSKKSPLLNLFCSDSANLSLQDKSIDAIVVDPPYYNNVMYGEMADFFYIWLKRLTGDIFPGYFRNELTNKMDEAVANSALYKDIKKSKEASNLHYQSKMQAAFSEMNRVLKDDGIMAVMFTHKEVDAWSHLTKALGDAGFTFRASWPVFTEPGMKFGKADKGVLKVTIILSCIKRKAERKGLWSEVKRELEEEAKARVKEYAKHGITGMDLLVSAFGPVLGKFTDYSLIKNSYGDIIGPEFALDVVSEAVNKYNTEDVQSADFDTLAYINLLRNFPMLTVDEDLARVTTVFGGKRNIRELETKGGKGMVDKKSGKVTILLSKDRYTNGSIDITKPHTLRSLIDVVHATLIVYESRGMAAVKELLSNTGKDAADSGFISVLKVISSFGMRGNGVNRKLSEESMTARLLLESMGLEPESVLKRGERMEHYL